jgi:hypothetical protein
MSDNNNQIERAKNLLVEARRGILTMIGGSGPFMNQDGEIFFTNIIEGKSTVFLVSQWDKLTDDLLQETEK